MRRAANIGRQECANESAGVSLHRLASKADGPLGPDNGYRDDLGGMASVVARCPVFWNLLAPTHPL